MEIFERLSGISLLVNGRTGVKMSFPKSLNRFTKIMMVLAKIYGHPIC